MLLCDLLQVLSIIYYVCLIQKVSCHSCGHQVPSKHEITVGVVRTYDALRSKRSTENHHHLRIEVTFDSSLQQLTNGQQDLVKNKLIPAAVEYWQGALLTRHGAGPIRLVRRCSSHHLRYKNVGNFTVPYCIGPCSNITKCGEMIVPESHLDICRSFSVERGFEELGDRGEGVLGTDYVLYVSTVETQRCKLGSTVAYAAYCQLEANYHKPVAGYINICPDDLSTKKHDYHQMLSTVRHEILHALGFSVGLYAFYRDPDGQPYSRLLNSTGKPPYNTTLGVYQWSDRVIKTVVRNDWLVRSGSTQKTINMIVTPKVLEEVRRHFNCSTLEGAELEDQGMEGTAFTHWEKRVFENEIMTGVYTHRPVISRITLALMEDTGWYLSVYEKADDLSWGKNLGCDFVKKSCYSWMASKQAAGESLQPFCNHVKRDALFTECTMDRHAVAVCNLIEYKLPLPTFYQHFNSIPSVPEGSIPFYGGSIVQADFCPYVQELTWKKDNVAIRGSLCTQHHNLPALDVNYLLENYGEKSRCIEHNQKWTVAYCDDVHEIDHYGSGCYEVSCTSEIGLVVVIYGTEFHCRSKGQVIDVKLLTPEWLHSGSIKCPSCEEICQTDNITCPFYNISSSQQTDFSSHVLLSPPCSIAVRTTSLRPHQFLPMFMSALLYLFLLQAS